MFLTSVILTWSRFKPCFLLDNVTYGFVTNSPVSLAPSSTSSYLSIGSLSLSSLLPFFDFICSSFPDLSQNVSMFRQTASFWLISSICASRSLKGEGGGKKRGDLREKVNRFSFIALSATSFSLWSCLGAQSCWREVNHLDHIKENFRILLYFFFLMLPELVVVVLETLWQFSVSFISF